MTMSPACRSPSPEYPNDVLASCASLTRCGIVVGSDRNTRWQPLKTGLASDPPSSSVHRRLHAAGSPVASTSAHRPTDRSDQHRSQQGCLVRWSPWGVALAASDALQTTPARLESCVD